MNTVITKVKEWLTPTLFLVIGYLVKNKMDVIDAKLDLIYTIQGQVSVLSVKVDRSLQDISQNGFALADLQKQFVEHIFKREDEITLDTLKHNQ